MSPLPLAIVNFCLRHITRRYLRRETDFARARRRWEQVVRLTPLPRGARFAVGMLEHEGRRLPAGRIDGPGDGPLLLWLHGGAYCMGSPRTHAPMVAELARRLGGRAVIPDYRLAPEHPFPAAVEDCLAAYRALAAEGLPARGLVLGGDSAGGGLVFALLHLLLAEGLALPRAVVAFSPWVDLTGSGGSITTMAGRDVMLPAERFAEIVGIYLRSADRRDPRASPVFGRFRGAPPVLILSSLHEILRDDARMMAERLRADGVAVKHHEYPHLPHVWPLFLGLLPEAGEALGEAAAFVAAQR